MIPRGRLDLSWPHLLAGVAMLGGWRPAAPPPPGIAGASVRALWGCLLDALALPPGARVGVSSPTVPGMVARLTERGLVPVPLAVTRDLRLPVEQLPEGLHALLVAHLFGVRFDLDPVVGWCAARGIPLIEDGAQVWTGGTGHPGALASLFSFGVIKRCTALGGAVAVVRDPALAARLATRVADLPPAPPSRFAARLLRATLVQLLATPWGCELLHGIAAGVRCDVDTLVRGLIRAHAPAAEADAMRFRLHPAEAAFLAWRLARVQATPEDHALRWHQTPGEWRVGSAQAIPSWTLPVQPAQPDLLVRHLRAHGQDATRRASALVDLLPPGPADLAAGQLVYLPTGAASFPLPPGHDTGAA